MSIETNRFKRKIDYKPVDRTRRVVQVRDVAEPSDQVGIPVAGLTDDLTAVTSPPDTLPVESEALEPAPTQLVAPRPVWAVQSDRPPEEESPLPSMNNGAVSASPAQATTLNWWDGPPQNADAIISAFGEDLFDRVNKNSRLRLPRLPLPSVNLEVLQKPLEAIWRRVGWQKSLIAMFVIVIALVPFVYRLGPAAHHPAEMAAGATGHLPVSSTSTSTNQLANAPSALGGNAASHQSVSNGYKPSPTLNFTPLVPTSEPQLAQLGSKAYDGTHGIYTYDDLYVGEPVRVSEELIPPSFDAATAVKDATNSVMRAPEPFSTGGGTGYIGVSTSTGAQVVVSAQKGILIFVQSRYQHPGASWDLYLGSLK